MWDRRYQAKGIWDGLWRGGRNECSYGLPGCRGSGWKLGALCSGRRTPSKNGVKQRRQTTPLNNTVKQRRGTRALQEDDQLRRRNDYAGADIGRHYVSMVLRADPSRLLVSRVAADVAKECTDLAKTFRGPGAFARG